MKAQWGSDDTHVKSEERYQTIFNSMTEGFAVQELITDANGCPCDCRFLDVNPAFQRLTGLDRAGVIGRRVRELLPDLEDFWIDTCGHVVTTGEPVRFVHGAAPLGRRYEVFAYKCGPKEFAVLFTDVTDRVSAEEKLEEAKQLLDALMENVPEGITIAEAPEGRIKMVSKHGQATLGGPHAGMTIGDVASRWRVYYGDGVTPMPVQELPLTRTITKGEIVRDQELVQLNSEGKRLTFSCNAAPLRNKNGDIVGGVAAWRDITDHKQAEEALRNSERLYRAIGESIDYGVWVCAPDGRNLYASKSFLDLVGQTQEECSNFGWGDVLHPDDAERTIAAWKECVRTGGTWDIEHRYRGVDGNWHSILARGVPVRDESGQVICWAGINLDISRLKKTEQQLKEINETLEQRVRERTALAEERSRQLSIAAGELTRAALRERQRLAQVLHDDLQQTLVGAKFNLGVVERRVDAADTRAAIAEVKSLLDQAVATSRSLTVELSPPVLQVGTMRQVLEWVAEWARQQYGLQVDVQVEDQVELQAQELRYILFRAVRELLLNVAKHARTDKAAVKMARAGAGEIQVEVSDQGIGFDAQAAGTANSDTSVGSRLGLFTIRERMEFSGGRLEVDSRPGQGTRVTIVVPCRIPEGYAPPVAALIEESPIAEPAEPQAVTSAGPRRKTIRVLLADDHAVLRDGLERLLKSQKGIEVVGQAADGVEAVELALKLKPDVILMDISMPRMDGVEATRQICERIPVTKIIGLSMHEQKHVAARMAAAGAVRYLTKTVPHDVLIAAIREAIRSGQAEEPDRE
ncbi:MAG: PAS domain S-box protein [Acidobacteriota bacterium]